MTGLKSLFVKKNDTSRYFTAVSEESLGDVEMRQDLRVVPNVDFSDYANFVHYGSAEEYGTRAVKWIYDSYPYDGSNKEREAWYRSGSAYDNYLFDQEYPKTRGYITIGYSSNPLERIVALGGPNVENVYEDGVREANIALSTNGMTVEFFANPLEGIADTATLFEITNTASCDSGSDDYFSFRVDLETGSAFTAHIETGSTVDSVTWNVGQSVKEVTNHYAFSLSPMTGSSFRCLFYKNGELEHSEVISYLYPKETGLNLYLGARSDGSQRTFCSYDEFRLWKVARNPKDIAENWFTNVYGGTNTQDYNLELGIYFKFNEGIVGDVAYDSVVLDYSGRASNGTWIGYEKREDYPLRHTEGLVGLEEVLDPIIYAVHPDVVSLLEEKREAGILYDAQNANAFYNGFPAWILEEDAEQGGNFKAIIQIVSSYLDELHMMIEHLPALGDVQYLSNDSKPLPFANRLLTSYGIVLDDLMKEADFREVLKNINDRERFVTSVRDIKNIIFHRLYDNLTSILNTKGTEESLRQALSCFGIDEKLYRLVTYPDNMKIVLDQTGFRQTSVGKKVLDFYDMDRFESTVVQTASADDEMDYVAGFEEDQDGALSIETAVVLPKKIAIDSEFYFTSNFLTASLGGYHETEIDSYDWTGSYLDFLVLKDGYDSNAGRFCLSSSIGNIVSDKYYDLYDDAKWHLSARLYPIHGEYLAGEPESYVLSFDGHKHVLDLEVDSFSYTASVSVEDARTILSAPKRYYVGALHANFLDSDSFYKSDARIADLKVWHDYLSDEEIESHSKDITAATRDFTEYSEVLKLSGYEIPKRDTNVLHWNFELVTGSNEYGNFDVLDVTSSSLDNASIYGTLSSSICYKHPGVGEFFPTSSTDVVNVEYLQILKEELPGLIGETSRVTVVSEDADGEQKNFKPYQHVHAFEKSMYRIISEEILRTFAALSDFNNLIGVPLDRYQPAYRRLNYLRNKYFSSVERTTFERFITFFKWLDSSVVTVISNLIPASAIFVNKTGEVVESHVLERNKIQQQLPRFKSLGSSLIEGEVEPHVVVGERMRTIEGTITMPTITGLSRANERGYANVQTVGRKTNNLWLRKHPEDFGEDYSESPYVEGVYDYELPERDRTEVVFAERFSAPGGPDVLARGTRDRESEEYSVYNALPWRNLGVRMALSELYAKHAGQFGYDSEYGAPSASYIKTNRNPHYITRDGETLVPRYDNEFVQHSIPANDVQYAWVTSAVDGWVWGYMPEDGMVYEDGEWVPFFDFGQPSNLEEAMDRDRFGYPTWKQLRAYERNDARNLRKENIIAVERQQRDGSISTASYHEPVVTWNAPMRHRLVDLETGEPGHLVYPFSNVKRTFAQVWLEDNLIDAKTRERVHTLYDDYSQMYLGDEKEAKMISLHYEESIFPRAVNVGSTTQRDKELYNESAGADGYDRGVLERRKIWDTSYVTRGRTFPEGKNAFDKEDYRNSVWPLDDNPDEIETGTRGKGGELNNRKSDTGGYRYTSFTGQDDDEKMATASALYAHNARLNLANAYEEGMPTWRVGEEAGVNPWYNSYEEYAEDLRPLSQRYGSLPEYRVSDYMDFFVNQNGGNFRASQNVPITLDGVEHSASSDAYLFLDHAVTDDIKYLDKLLREHEGYEQNTRLTLKCSGLKKLLPYNGFYPQQRTVQLASLFSGSFAEHIEGLTGEGIGTESVDQQDQWKLQALLQPWFAPGIVYNSIKSGVAVDWPMYLGVDGFNGSAGEIEGGKVVYLSGEANRGLVIPDEGGLDVPSDEWLGISFWFKETQLGASILLSRYNWKSGGDSSEKLFSIMTLGSSSGLLVLLSIFDGVSALPDNMICYYEPNVSGWHHVAVTLQDNLAVTLYVDGVLGYDLNTYTQGAMSIDYALASGSGVPLIVGNSLAEGELDTSSSKNPCYIDDLAYYTGSARLSDNDIQEIYAAGRCSNFDLNIVEPAPVYWWKMGDGEDGASSPDGTDGLIFDVQNDALDAQMTGSTIVNGCSGGDFGFLSKVPNFRIPFESMFALNNFVPASSSIEDNSIYFLAPEWYTSSAELDTTRHPYFTWDGEKSNELFELAAHNFFGEVPRFTLQNNGLASYVSAPSTQYEPMESGSTYYMDVVLHKTPDLQMIYSLNHGNDNYDYNGKYFGPAVQMVEVPELYTGSENLYKLAADPTYAAYAPSYMYGKAVARLSFTAVQSRQYTLDEILAGVQVEYINDGLVDKAYDATEEDILSNGSPLWSSSMNLTASVEIRGKAKIPEVEHVLTSDGTYIPASIRDVKEAGYMAWAIYPKFECPVLNFADVDTGSFNAEHGPYGMWLNYGSLPTGNEGIYFSIEESFKKKDGDELVNTGSLLEICGFVPSSRKIGEVAHNKEIHEAIVAIPFVDNVNTNGAKTTKVGNYNFFAIDKIMYALQNARKKGGLPAIPKGTYGAVEDIQNTTITDMTAMMRKYYMPPEFDFVTYPDIQPFAMYIFEFTSNMTQEDLSKYWQGVMPSIATKVEKEDVTISHSLSEVEFFGGEKLPSGIRWLLFKVKQRAEKSYYSLTADSRDDARFEFDFAVGKKAPEYSYNWPYDFFSLVENVKIDASLDIIPNVNLRVRDSVVGDVFDVESKLGNVAKQVSQDVKNQKLDVGGNIINAATAVKPGGVI